MKVIQRKAVKTINCFLLFLSFWGKISAQANKHVILISIDGFRPEMYQDKTYPTPNLHYLMKQGVYANHMKSVFPAYTYPSHTAMLTGALPARSKICYNQPIGSHGEWYWESKYVKVPTIWEALHKQGLTTAAIMWPGTVGADIDYNISEIWDKDHPDDRSTEVRKYTTPKGLYEDIEQNATGKLDSTNMNDNYFSLDENAARMAAYVFQKYKPNFLALHFASVDGMEHEYGRDGDSVRLAIAANDRAIGTVLEAVQKAGLRDSTTILIVGDHGFSNFNTVFRPNMMIQDVSATFISAGGSAFLYRYSNTTINDIPSIVTSVEENLNRLPKEQRKLFRIIERKELDKMGADSAALLAIAAKPGLIFSSGVSKSSSVNNGPGTTVQQIPLEGLFISMSGGHHGYDPDEPEMHTGFIAAGRAVNKGAVIKELCVTDIAPLIATLLNIEFNVPDGKLIQEIINP